MHAADEVENSPTTAAASETSASPAPEQIDTEAADSAQPAPGASEPTLEARLHDLTQASLAQTPGIVTDLARIGGRDLLPLFEAMLAGELYYDEGSLQLMRIAEDGAGIDQASDILSGEALGPREPRSAGKVRINNRLRTQLRDTIARINLTDGTDAQRRAAARAILNDVNEDSVVLLREAAATEDDAGVRELLTVGIAMRELTVADTDEKRLAAIAALDGRLETPVRNLLTRYRDDPDGQLSEAVQDAADSAVANSDASVEFYRFIEQLFFGLSLGSVLLLAAIGLAVTFGVMGVINMAHGEMLMLGAYSTYVVQQLMPNSVNASVLVSIPVAFVVTALVGMLIQRYVIRYLGGRPLETLLATFGISLILQQAVRTVFSPLNRRVVSPEWLSGSWQYNEVLSLTNNRICILLFSLLVFAILQFILRKTSLGLDVRAVSQNRAMAQAMGIRTERVDALTFGLGSGIAGIAGVALSQLTNVGPNLGQTYIIDSFMVVVFGGVGNLFGTLIAAFSLGTANKFLEPLTGAVLANILILVFIILFIQKRPKGLFPQKGRAAD
ncbi:MAG TPA: urea ABC transporter permease subunit UrtB [Pseudomonadales bacterium]